MAFLNTSLNIGLVASLAVGLGGLAENYVQSNAPKMVEGSGYVDMPVMQGGKTYVHLTLVKLTSCPGDIWPRWEGENGFIQVEPRRKTFLEASQYPQFPNMLESIPSKAPIGKLDLFYEVEYDCGTGERFMFTIGPIEMEVVSQYE